MSKEVIESLNGMTGLLKNNFGELYEYLDSMQQNLLHAIDNHHDHDMESLKS